MRDDTEFNRKSDQLEGKYSGHEELLTVEENLKCYNTDIAKRVVSTLHQVRLSSQETPNILDFGAGIGTLAQIVHGLVGIRPKCIEIDSLQTTILKSKGFDAYQSLKDVPEKADLIYSSNVLEHIIEDEKVLVEIYSSLVVGGYLFIYVPAHQFLFSELDEKVGHVRRYSRKELEMKVKSSGFTIIRIEYHDSLGFLASLCLKYFGFKRKLGLGSPASYQMYDSIIFPISKILDRVGLRRIIGKNILLVAKK
jgi:SAM-dependent methyltransferase